MSEMFWEHAEASYLRLASFWDRIGQLLDFVFFNIRQYERDGFSAVLSRIRSNYVPLFLDLDFSGPWNNLWNYQKSENVDGLGWLIRRRNLLVHSLHLGPIEVGEKENAIFALAFNHLDETISAGGSFRRARCSIRWTKQPNAALRCLWRCLTFSRKINAASLKRLCVQPVHLPYPSLLA
jgi:hypothetical protein